MVDLNQGQDFSQVVNSIFLRRGINEMAEELQASHENLQSKIDSATYDLKYTLKLLESKNKELEIAKKDAVDTNKIKSGFLANMSHEIRTPINGIIGFTDLLLKSSADATQIHHLDMIKKSSLNLLAIVNDILDITKIEAGELNITSEKMNLHDCLEQVMKMMAPATFNKGLELTLLYYSDVQEDFFSDPLRINQIITNLLSNAIKFTENGSITIRVMIEEDNDEISLIKFSVTDTGIGIPEEQYDYLFKPFVQGDNSTTKKHSGSGLGLSIVYNLVERMGGKIGFDSNINTGTTFWFTLPLEKNKEKKSFLIPAPIKNKNIALIDLNSISRLSIKHILAQANISVHEYDDIENIDSILTLQSANHLDTIIISCNSNNMKKLTPALFDNLHKITDSKILVMVPSIDNATISSITEKGADLCISKPVFRDRLYRTLSFLLNNKLSTEISSDISEHRPIKNKCYLKILIAEDNDINANLLSTIIKQHGSHVSIATDGEMVLDLISKSHFDIILMDINMPVLDGVNTTKVIRENCEHYPCDIPVIAITANALEKDRDRFKAIGINDLIIKPITEESIWTSINNLTNHTCLMEDNLSEEIKKLIPSDMYEKVKLEISEHTKIISAALKQNDMDTLFTHIHKLNGLASYFNVPAIKDIADKLETSIKNNNNRSTLESHVELLHSEVEKMNN